MAKIKAPKVGQKIYVGGSMSISHGSTDVIGGIATVISVEKKQWGIEVCVKEHPGHCYNWGPLAERQEELKKEYGKRKARPDPDIDTPWIEDGDIVNGQVYHGKDIW